MPGKFNLNDYIDVQERINRFWQENPDGAIRTVLLSTPDNFDQVVFQAEVYKHRDNATPDATGIAAEAKGQGGMANSTSWHENGETSSIGRALANMGYATSLKDRPSRQEMEKAAGGPQSAPNAPKPANAGTDMGKVMARLHAAAAKHGIDHDGLHALVAAKGYNSMRVAPDDVLLAIEKALTEKPGDLKAWLAKQAQLLPGTDEVPNPDRFTN